MQSRMDKYNANSTQIRSRTQKNHDLYEDVRNSSLTEFDIKPNVAVIDNEADVIDVKKVQKLIDERYKETTPKRKSIEIPIYDEPVIEEPVADTKEYDINAIIQKAKQGKSVDYTKERLKKVREAQYEILNNLDLEIKKDEESINEKRKKEEENLMDLINTITQIEMKNKEKYTKDISEALDLLSDLKDEEDEEDTSEEPFDYGPETTEEYLDMSTEITEDMQEVRLIPAKKKTKVVEIEEEDDYEEVTEETELYESSLEEETDEYENFENTEEFEETIEQETSVKEDKDDHIEETLSKLNINMSSYDEFSDINKKDPGTILLKIFIFIVIVTLVVGGVYIVDMILELGLF